MSLKEPELTRARSGPSWDAQPAVRQPPEDQDPQGLHGLGGQAGPLNPRLLAQPVGAKGSIEVGQSPVALALGLPY